MTKGQIPLACSCKPKQTTPLSLPLTAGRLKSSPRGRAGSCLSFVPCCYICRVLSFPLKEVSQGRGASGPVWLRYQDLQRPVSQTSQASSQRALLALGPALGPPPENNPQAAPRPSFIQSRQSGVEGHGNGKRLSAALPAPFFNPLPWVSALAPPSQALTLRTFRVFLHLRHGKGRRVTEPRRRGGGGAQAPRVRGVSPRGWTGGGSRRLPSSPSRSARRKAGEEWAGARAAAPQAAGGRSWAIPAEPGRTEVLWSLPNSPACFSSLPPSPHPSPPPRLFPPFSGRHLPESLFSVVLELASRWRRGGAASAGRGPAAHRPDTAGPSGRRTASRPGAPSACRSALSKLLLSVCGHARAGGLYDLRAGTGDRGGYLWMGSLDSEQG